MVTFFIFKDNGCLGIAVSLGKGQYFLLDVLMLTTAWGTGVVRTSEEVRLGSFSEEQVGHPCSLFLRIPPLCCSF